MGRVISGDVLVVTFFRVPKFSASDPFKLSTIEVEEMGFVVFSEGTPSGPGEGPARRPHDEN